MKFLLILGFFQVMITINSTSAFSTEEVGKTSSYWTCSMHPEVHTDHPGDCPICHMKLIKKETLNFNNFSQINQRKIIMVDNKSFELSGAKLISASKGPFTYSIRAFGKMNANKKFSMYVSEREQKYLRIGNEVEIKIPAQDLVHIKGVVDRIDTNIDPMARTIRVDGTIKHSDNFRAETSLLCTIYFTKNDILKIPEDAVLHSGEKNYVFIYDQKNSTLTPTPVRIGLISGGEVEIIEGLTEGSIVTSHSNFLIDSESRMRFNYDKKDN